MLTCATNYFFSFLLSNLIDAFKAAGKFISITVRVNFNASMATISVTILLLLHEYAIQAGTEGLSTTLELLYIR